MKNKYKKSSVIFIDEESLISSSSNDSAWSENIIKKSSNISSKTWKKIKTIPGSKAGRIFPATFRNYLFSENSILIRLTSSLIPPFFGRFKRIAVDPEGTFLSTFLLSSIIYLGFINSRSVTRLYAMLASIILSLGYITFSSVLICLISLLTKTVITFRQTVCVMGYGLFGHCLTLLICEVVSHEWFILSMIFFGGLDTTRICLILFFRTPIAALRFVLCAAVAIIHLLYLVYLHFAIMKM